MRVLLVEDEVRLAETLRRGLSAEGFVVDVVHDGALGASTARENAYDVVVLDVMLPGLNGYEGIPDADREKVFERFVRLDESRDRAGGGTGLGLPIARQVAREHGGDLTVEASDHGATLCLRLPHATG